MSMLIEHLNNARNELVLAFNTAENSKLKDSTMGIAFMIAKLSALIQFHEIVNKK